MRERQCLIEEDLLKQVSLHLRDGSLIAGRQLLAAAEDLPMKGVFTVPCLRCSWSYIRGCFLRRPSSTPSTSAYEPAVKVVAAVLAQSFPLFSRSDERSHRQDRAIHTSSASSTADMFAVCCSADGCIRTSSDLRD